MKTKRHYCNNGVVNKYWYDETGIPEGFVDGHLPYSNEQRISLNNKIKKTNLERHGVENTFNIPDVLAKSHSPEVIEIQKKNREITKEKRYGDKNWSNNEKAMITNNERHGGVLNGSNEIRLKSEIAKEELYGDKNYSNRDKAVKTRAENGFGYCFRKFYIYKNIHFDSSWELYYYIFHDDKKDNIRRCTTYFNYLFENKNHTYTPDFVINDVLVDVKGSHFIEEDKMINPYDRSLDELYETKHQCMISNNVKLILEEEINNCKLYVDQKYGQNYIDQFEVTK